MKSILAAALALASSLAHSAIEVASPETWTLYRGTSIVQPRVAYPSKAACQAAAALDVQRCDGGNVLGDDRRCCSAEHALRAVIRRAARGLWNGNLQLLGS